MKKAILKIKDTVEQLLTEYPETRDNDELLILKVWALQEPRLRSAGYAFYEFAVKYKVGKFANAESIRRSRAKLQEVNPSLRGKRYEERLSMDQPTAEMIVQNELFTKNENDE